MGVREYLNNNSAVATIIAVVVLMIALGIMVWSNRGGGGAGSGQMFYYDLNTQTISRQPRTSPSPLDTGNGTFKYFDGNLGSSVRATIFACDEDFEVTDGMTLSELEAAGGKVTALYRFTPQAQARQIKIDNGETLTDEEMNYEMMDSGLLVADLDGQNWYPETSDQAAQLTMSSSNLCGGERAHYVTP